ncbi:hypothetical protein APICC_08863 [Apis cerana cerana]|uniref:Uncharacterized protein n=1 Tax=Apis cerana cerana TaxID=94128 RepID=A0A2A3ETY6_APICC|nr:hypothetical protein APICC_08863 [Apis cerana cerana]
MTETVDSIDVASDYTGWGSSNATEIALRKLCGVAQASGLINSFLINERNAELAGGTVVRTDARSDGVGDAGDDDDDNDDDDDDDDDWKMSWFSVVSNNSGTGSARVYRRVGALVRAGVPAFLLAKPLRAYTLTHSKMENGNLRAHYTKTTVRAGEVLRLAAVFQDTRRAPVPSGISGVVSAPEGKSSRSSERDQYAQCLDSHGHELFAPLSARGEFYATCQSGSLDTGSDAVLYRVHQLARRDLPLRVRLVAGPLPIPLPRDYSGLMQLEGATRGPIVLGCAVPLMPERPLPNSTVPELLELVATGPTAPREIKSKPEAKPILQSLKEGLEHIKRTTIRDRSNGRAAGGGNNHGFLDRISRIAQGGRGGRNPAKKSASFTFAVRPEIGMRSERYASLESEANLIQASAPSSRHQVQRSVSTSVLEVQTQQDMDPPYSKVRDSLTPLPSTPPSSKTEEIYAEICEPTTSPAPSPEEKPPPPPPPPEGRNGTREKDRGYVKLALSQSEISNVGEEEEGIYNTVC